MSKSVFFVTALSAILFGLGLHASSNKSPYVARSAQAKTQDVGDLEVRILPVKNMIAAGDTLSVRVEIWNMGSQDLFICKNFDGVRLVFCDLSLSFDPHAIASRTEWAVDANPDQNETLANALVRNWISIPPRHFYGEIIELNPRTYPELRTAGRYRIRGRYVSPGLLGSGYYNNLLKYSEEVSKLPGKSWQGEIDTNTVDIRVTAKKS